jgi:hypothetical protein
VKDNKTPKQLILETLKEKSSVKQDVFYQTIAVFKMLKEVLAEFATEYSKDAQTIDKRLIIEYTDKGEFQAELKVAGDVLIFHMHTNVFDFDRSHQIWKTSYVNDDNGRSLCGMISIFNFLSDSFKYNRFNDLGYLIGRLFVNRELHYFVEGKRQLGFLYNDFVNNKLDKSALKSVVESAILYSLAFDLYSPPYDQVKTVSVAEILESNSTYQIKTGKRLGFKFQADADDIL